MTQATDPNALSRILEVIAEHYDLHENLPTAEQIYSSTATIHGGSSSGYVKKSKVEQTFRLLKDAGVITEPGVHTDRPHLTAKGFPWIEKLVRDYCYEEVEV